jgi:predicted HicB family RNase H-like nuclease
MMSYRGYVAKVEFDPEAFLLHGEIADISDVVTFQATCVADLEREFHAAVDDYLAFCEENGMEPQKPYSGRVLLRMDPQLHRDAARSARIAEESLNTFLTRAVRKSVQENRP